MKRIIRILSLSAVIILTMISPIYADNNSVIIGNNNIVVFSDVSQGHWAREQIESFSKQGIINGYADGTFRPENGVTREEFCKLLVATFKPEMSKTDQVSFSDVQISRWSHSFIEYCKNFLTGYANPFGGLPAFHPTDYATREDIAVALVRMMGLTDTSTNEPNYIFSIFHDAGRISPELVPYVSIAYERGLISGFTDGTFRPAEKVTRAEVVTLLNRATKQAVANINQELRMEVEVGYSKDGKTAKVFVTTPEKDAMLEIDGKTIQVFKDTALNYPYWGMYEHKFGKEEKKTVTVVLKKSNKKIERQVEIEYKISGPVITITKCPPMVNVDSAVIEGKVTDVNDNYSKIAVTLNNTSIELNSYSSTFSQKVKLKEGKNDFVITAVNSLGKKTEVKKTIEFTVDKPTITITKCPPVVNVDSAVIEGKVTDVNDNYSKIAVTLNNTPIELNNYNDMFSVKVKLKEGKNDFVITAVNSLGKKTEVKKTIEFTVDKPTITITKCPPVVNVDSAVIEGKVTDVNDNYSKIAVTLNNAPIELNNYNDMFSVKVKLKEGKNDFVITAVNSLGKKTEVKRTIEFTADKPTITITKCPPVVNEDEAIIEGKVTDVNDSCSKITVTLNDTPIALNEWNDMFSQRVKLKEGENEFIIAAVNSLGKRSEEKRIIKFKVLGPTIEIIKCPASVTSDTAVIEAKVTDTVDSYSALTVTVNEIPVSLNNWNNMFSREVSLREGENEIIIKATNSLGKTTIEKRTVVFDVAAPSLDLTYCPVISHQEKIAITGKVNDDRDEIGNLYLEINNERVTTDSSGNWSKELALQPGENQINIKVTNGFGKVKEENRVITYRTENSEAEPKTE